MKLINLLGVIDFEQKMSVCVEKNGNVQYKVCGDQASIKQMLSIQILDADVTSISARDGNVIWVWLEESD